jgi:integrase
MGSRALNLLTAKAVDNARPREREYYLRDGAGLFVRVYPSGLRRACYRFDDAAGRTRRIEHPTPLQRGGLTLEKARAWRDELTALRAAGVNPVDTLLAQRRANALRVAARPGKRARKAPTTHSSNRPGGGRADAPLADLPAFPSATFGAIAVEYLTRVIARTYRDPSQARRLVEADLLPQLGALPIATLRLADVQGVLNTIVDRGAPVAANRALLMAKKILRYARVQGHIESNLLADVTRADVGGREGERERALAFDEIPVFWRVVSTHAGLAWQTRACLLLLLLTGQRIGETLAARWADVDLEAGLWRLPAETTKAGRPHLVHLGSLALELLAAIQARAGTRKPQEPIFCADGTDDTAVARRSVTRALERLLAAPAGKPAALPLAHFTPHDLRRTVRSRLSDLGVAPHVAEKLLNHRLGGVLQVYDRAEYLPERAQAIAAWDTKLRALLATEAQPAAAPAVRTPEQPNKKRPRRRGDVERV